MEIAQVLTLQFMIMGVDLLRSKKNKSILNNEHGQALFEAMIFIPILLYLVVMMITIGNSISTSINQNQAARTYTFYIMQGNSDGSGAFDIDRLQGQLSVLGSFMIGWSEEMAGASGNNPVGANFKIPSLPWAPASDENCKDKSNPEDTSCIKIFTLFGVCGETFVKTEDILFRSTDPSIAQPSSSCGFN